MATIFVNSLLYIWPISALIYGSGGNIPIMAAVVWDATVTFAFFIITTDLLANRGQSAGQSLLRLVKNPVLIAIALGLGSNGLGVIAPEPLLVACKFAGAGAAPLTLFALGVILSGHSLWPTKKVAAVAGIKLLLMPVIVVSVLAWGVRPELWNDLLLLNGAGPSGAMAFALADALQSAHGHHSAGDYLDLGFVALLDWRILPKTAVRIYLKGCHAADGARSCPRVILELHRRR
jgi:predicted permease